MKTRNGMQAIRARTITTLKVAAVAAVLSFGGLLAGGTAPASAQEVLPWPEKVIRIGPFKVCILICWAPGYCCTWLDGQL